VFLTLDLVTLVLQVQMRGTLRQMQAHCIALTMQHPYLAHSLDDETVIMRQEEDAARLAWGWQLPQCLVPCKVTPTEVMTSDKNRMPLNMFCNFSFA
jgi:hypothetical protein